MQYTNSQITELIKEYIHDKTARKILYLRFVDNDTLDEIAAKVGLDKTTVWRKIRKNEKELFSHIPG
jgi:DNA-directed RNA polymerase specialized sigma subunit